MKELNKFYDEAVFKEAEESSARNSVLSKSLAIEKYLSIYLARILDINNHLDSKSFGNTSSALSFNQKTLLISDLKYLDKDDKLKLLSFAEIRNNFAHNSDCLTFKDAFTVDLKNRIKKFYPALKSDVAVESDYEGAVIFLFNELELFIVLTSINILIKNSVRMLNIIIVLAYPLLFIFIHLYSLILYLLL